MLHPKIRCFNFKPQYLLNYTSPTNDLYSVQKRSIGAFKSIFELLGLGPASTNENWENGKSALIFLLIFSRHFLDFGDIASIFREKAPNAMQYCLKCLLKGLFYHTISWCVKNLQKQNVPNLAHWPS